MSFLHGFILAIGLILPLGVQNAYLFHQGAVQPKWIKVIPAVLVAGLCDTLLIVVAVLGVSVMILKFSIVKYALVGLGVVFLFIMGISMWKSNGKISHQADHAYSIKKQMLFTLSVSLLNPHAIMDTVGVIGINSLQYQGWDKMMYTIATILVSFLWFFFLTIAGRFVRSLNNQVVLLVNKVSALIMWGSAVYLSFRFIT